MKILIITTPRSGSTSLVKTLSHLLNLSIVNIPNAYTYPKNKSLIDHLISQDKNVIVRMNPIQNVGYSFKDFVKFFDHVFLLTRKNKEDHFKSVVNLIYKENIKKEGENYTYHYSEIPQKFIKEFKSNKNWYYVLKAIGLINKISNELSIPILYYEDLYYGNGIELILKKIKNLDKSLFQKELFKTKKLRKKYIKKTLI